MPRCGVMTYGLRLAMLSAGFSSAAAPRPCLKQQAASLQPRLMTNRLCSLPTSFVRRFITNTEAEKSAIYRIIETRFFEGKKSKFDAGLNCTTPHLSRPTASNRSRLLPIPGSDNEDIGPSSQDSCGSSLSLHHGKPPSYVLSLGRLPSPCRDCPIPDPRNRLGARWHALPERERFDCATWRWAPAHRGESDWSAGRPWWRACVSIELQRFHDDMGGAVFVRTLQL